MLVMARRDVNLIGFIREVSLTVVSLMKWDSAYSCPLKPISEKKKKLCNIRVFILVEVALWGQNDATGGRMPLTGILFEGAERSAQ